MQSFFCFALSIIYLPFQIQIIPPKQVFKSTKQTLTKNNKMGAGGV